MVLRWSLLAVGVVVMILAWRWYRPTRAHVGCAALAGLVGALGDLWIEVLLFRAGIWEHTGRIAAFSIAEVPLEMPLSFLPATMAGVWSMGFAPKLGLSLSPARATMLLFFGWCTFGIVCDMINISMELSMRASLPLSTLTPFYIAPFWLLVSAAAPFVYWLSLAVVAPKASVFNPSRAGCKVPVTHTP